MYDIIFGTIVFVLFYCKKVAVSMWIMAIWALITSIEKGGQLLFLEIIEDYPKADCVNPSKYKFLFKKMNKLSANSIPKEIYYSKLIKYIGLWIYTVVGSIALTFNEKVAVVIGFVYYLIAYGMDIIFMFIAKRKSFLARFKKINIYNFIYLFNGADEPYPKMKGKCKIVSEYKRRKQKYVTVMMLETGEVKENILFPGNKRQGKEPIYSLYEICKVFYIV